MVLNKDRKKARLQPRLFPFAAAYYRANRRTIPLNLASVGKTFAAGAVLAFAGAAYVNLVKRAVAAVVIVLAVGYVASDTEIDVFHYNSSVKHIVCRAR